MMLILDTLLKDILVVGWFLVEVLELRIDGKKWVIILL